MTRILFAALLSLVAGAAFPGGFQGNMGFNQPNQVLAFALIDGADPTLCPAADLTHDTAGLVIRVRHNNTAGWYDTYTVTGTDDLEANTTVGTHDDPSDLTAPGTARFGVVSAGACQYELDLPDAVFAVSGATQIYVEVKAGGDVMDDLFWWDLTGVDIDDFTDEMLSASTVGYTDANTVGKHLGQDIPSILVDTGTTLDAKVDTISTAVVTTIPTAIAGIELPALWDGVVDSVTSQTVIVSEEGPAPASLHVGRSMCIYDADVPGTSDCALITGYNQITLTWTLANALGFTVEVGDEMFIPALDARIIGVDDSVSIPVGSTRPRARLTPTP